jgi:glycosyltransferase involved in cell wall biosynthesis
MIIVTDTYQQTNGVSTTYKNLEKVASKRGRALQILHPGLYNWVPMPGYPEIQLAIQPIKFWQTLNKINPEKIHIATEGSMGLVARTWCRWHKKTFTTSYHTKFPEYLKVMFGVPLRFTYWYMRKFHSKAKATFITTPSVKNELTNQGFKNLVIWTRGVADDLVHNNLLHEEIQPVNSEKLRVLYVGRVSREKNIAALCQYENDFEITVVGNGPHFEELNATYKTVKFIGYKFGEELAKIYAQHDVFAFPSHTDTFGIVMIEAMCNGLPVAGYNVAGPKDVVQQGVTGVVGDNLYDAIIACKSLDRAKIKRDSLAKWSWDSCFDIFTTHLDAK